MLGTPSNTDTWSRSMISSALTGSKRGSSVSMPAATTQVFIAHVCPNEWNSGSAPSTTVPCLQVEEPAGSAAVAQQVVVRQLGTLRRAGGARGVEQHRWIRGFALHQLLTRGGLEQRLFELAGHHGDALAAHIRRGGLGLSREVVPDEEQLGARIAEVVLDLAAPVEHVHRHDNRAGAQNPVVGDDEVGHVRQHQRHTVARLDPSFAQHTGDPHGGLLQQPVVECEVVELDGNLLRVAGRRLPQYLGKVHDSLLILR